MYKIEMKTTATTPATAPALRRGRVRLAALTAVLTLLVSACYFPAAARYTERTGAVPWWCQGSPDLTIAECLTFSLQLDLAIDLAHQYPTLAAATGAGATAVPGAPEGTGHAVALPGAATEFRPGRPNVLLYTGADPADRLAGVAWRVAGALPPEGFDGPRDAWAQVDGAGDWWLAAWVIRGYENHPQVFAATHPCLASGVTLNSTSDPCFLASHTVPLEIMVTNDDGFEAPGIDALVAGLTDDPNDPADTFVAGANITVVAPLTQQSGQGDKTTPGGAPTASEGLTTASGYPVLAAVHGTPADAVIWALEQLLLSPDVVLSGINEGQNLATLGHLASGTVGAARTARRRGFNAIATSAEAFAPDWPTSTTATLALVEDWRVGKAGVPFMRVPNINIPSCTGGGTVRGTIETVVGVDLSSGGFFDPTNCNSIKPEGSIVDDLDAFLNGFISIADMGQNQPPNFP